jgi:hypothetical protein
MPTKICRYSVPPFSRIPPRLRGVSSAGPECAICGRPLKPGAKMFPAVVVDGGVAWGDEASDENDPGHMGGFDVGPECHRKYAIKEPS